MINSCQARHESVVILGKHLFIADDLYKKSRLNEDSEYKLLLQIFNSEINLMKNVCVNEKYCMWYVFLTVYIYSSIFIDIFLNNKSSKSMKKQINNEICTGYKFSSRLMCTYCSLLISLVLVMLQILLNLEKQLLINLSLCFKLKFICKSKHSF